MAVKTPISFSVRKKKEFDTARIHCGGFSRVPLGVRGPCFVRGRGSDNSRAYFHHLGDIMVGDRREFARSSPRCS